MAIEIYRAAALVASFETRGGREFAVFYGAEGAELRARLERAQGLRTASWADRAIATDLAAEDYRVVTRPQAGDLVA